MSVCPSQANVLSKQLTGSSWFSAYYPTLYFNGIRISLNSGIFSSGILSKTLNLADFWATVCKTVRPVQRDRCLSVCLSCLSVTLVFLAKRLDGSKCHLVRRYRSRPRRYCVRWGPSSLPRKWAQQPPLFGPCLLWRNGRPSQQLLSSCCDSFATARWPS